MAAAPSAMPHGKMSKKLSGIDENPYAWGKTARSAERARARALGRVSSRRARYLAEIENDSRLWALIARHSRQCGRWLLHGVALACFVRGTFLFLYHPNFTLGDAMNKT